MGEVFAQPGTDDVRYMPEVPHVRKGVEVYRTRQFPLEAVNTPDLIQTTASCITKNAKASEKGTYPRIGPCEK